MGIDILIIESGWLSEGSGRCPENPQGTSLLTLCPGAARIEVYMQELCSVMQEERIFVKIFE